MRRLPRAARRSKPRRAKRSSNFVSWRPRLSIRLRSSDDSRSPSAHSLSRKIFDWFAENEPTIGKTPIGERIENLPSAAAGGKEGQCWEVPRCRSVSVAILPLRIFPNGVRSTKKSGEHADRFEIRDRHVSKRHAHASRIAFSPARRRTVSSRPLQPRKRRRDAQRASRRSAWTRLHEARLDSLHAVSPRTRTELGRRSVHHGRDQIRGERRGDGSATSRKRSLERSARGARVLEAASGRAFRSNRRLWNVVRRDSKPFSAPSADPIARRSIRRAAR